MKLKFKDSIKVINDINENKICILDDYSFYTLEYDLKIKTSINLLVNGCCETDLYRVLGVIDGLGFIKDFQEKHLLTKFNDTNEQGRFLQQKNYYSEFKENDSNTLRDMNSKVVAIIGLGGVGSCIARHLLTSGIYNLILIDGDTVENTNLNRQQYFEYQIGIPKVEALNDTLKKIDSNVRCSTYYSYISSDQDLIAICKGLAVDMVICCADEPKNDIEINVAKSCIELECACVFSGLNVNYGYWGPLLDCEYNMLLYIDFINEVKSFDMMSSRISSSTSFTNDVVSSLEAKDIIHYLGELSIPACKNKILRYDFNNNKVEVIKYIN